MKTTIITTIAIAISLSSCATQYAENADGAVLLNSSMGGRTQATCAFASFNSDHNESFKDFSGLAKAAIWGSVAKASIKGMTSTTNTASKTSLAKVKSGNSASVAKNQSNNALSASKDLNKTNLGIIKDNNKTKTILERIKGSATPTE